MRCQFQEKGSYRTEDVVEFLNWALPDAHRPEDSIVVLLDWFAPHCSDEVRELVNSKGHVLLLHGGGVTGIEQANAPRPCLRTGRACIWGGVDSRVVRVRVRMRVRDYGVARACVYVRTCAPVHPCGLRVCTCRCLRV